MTTQNKAVAFDPFQPGLINPECQLPAVYLNANKTLKQDCRKLKINRSI